MSLGTLFQKWVKQGLPHEKRPHRDLSVPNAINSVQWNKLISVVKAKTVQALAKELDALAGQKLPRSTPQARKSWKQTTAGNFYFTLPAHLQDELCPAGPALRSGLMDAATAELLGVDWEPQDSSAEAAGSASSCWPETNAVTVAVMSSGRERRQVAEDVVQRIADQAKSPEDAAALFALVQKKLGALSGMCGQGNRLCAVPESGSSAISLPRNFVRRRSLAV